MEKSTEINDEESSVENDIDILKTRAKEYGKNLNQMMSTLTPKSKKKPQKIVFMKCSDHVGTTSNLWLDENAQCLSCIKSESLQTLKDGVFSKNCDVISLLMTERAQNTGKKVYNFYECAIIVSLSWIYCKIYAGSIRTVERKIEGNFKMDREIKKIMKRNGS